MTSMSIIAELCIYVLTWNVGTHSPKDTPLTSLLSLNGTTNCPENKLPDLYVIGMQEVNTDASKQVLGLFKDDPWILKIASYLVDYDYVKVDSEQLQGILITMFALTKHIPHIQDIETDETATGIGGIWGNKGAVSIRMSLYGTGVAFVCSHLAAHDHKLKNRIDDYHKIVDKHKYSLNRYSTIFDHDYVFWFGDLNFRLSGDDSAWDIRTSVEQGKFSELLQFDQLGEVRESGNAFSLLNEQLPTFPPTFKFIEGTNDYDLKRRPAWCDRILYRVQTYKYPDIKLSIEQLSYNSHMDYSISDHKPVSAVFLYKIESNTTTDQDLHDVTHGASTEVNLYNAKLEELQ